MLLGRLLGWLSIALALLAFGGDYLRWLQSGSLQFAALGELWYRLHPGSLNLAQAVIQRYLFPQLWDPGIVTILTWPAAAVLGGLGIILLIVFRKRASRPRPRFGALS